MNPTNLKLLRDWATLALLSDPLTKVVVYNGTAEVASVEPVVVPPPVVTPADPPNTTRIKSLDDVDLNAKANWTYILEGVVVGSKKQTINKPGIVIKGADDKSALDVNVKWLEDLITVDQSATGFGVQNLRVCGHDGATAFQIQGTSGVIIDHVSQFAHPVHKGGVTPVEFDGSANAIVQNFKTERTARYSCYAGDASHRGNKAFTLQDFDFGPCKVVEDEKLSGLYDIKRKKNQPLHGGGYSEHCYRVYGANGVTIRRGKMSNPKNADGKQAMKVMSGKDVTIEDVAFDGSTRFGRDALDADQKSTLKNVTVARCTFTEWTRIDPGTEIKFEDSTLHSLDQKPGTKVDLQGVKVSGVLTTKAIKR